MRVDNPGDWVSAISGLVVAATAGVLAVVVWPAFWAGLAEGIFALGLIVRHLVGYRQGAGLVWIVAASSIGGVVVGVMFIIQIDQLLENSDEGRLRFRRFRAMRSCFQ